MEDILEGKGEWFYPLKPAVQLISNISEGTYTSFPKAIREIVNNSFDAEAGRVNIKFNEDYSELTIEDDGEGITSSGFDEKFLRISGSTRRLPSNKKKKSNRPIIGRYGIGVLAIAPICEYAVIRSKVKGELKGIERFIPLKHLFRQDLLLANLDQHFRYKKGPDFTDDRNKQYTIIRFVNLREDIRKQLFYKRKKAPKDWTDVSQLDGIETFKWHLGLLVPVQYKDDYPVPGFETQLIAQAKKDLARFNFKVIVNGEELLKPVCLRHKPHDLIKWRYDTSEIPKEECDVFEIESNQNDTVKFFGYIYSQSKQIFPVSLRGVLIRISHIGIQGYSRSFFGYTGSSLGGAAEMISGEIFVEDGLEEALTMDKDDFKVNHPAYVELTTRIQEEIHKVAVAARNRSKALRVKKTPKKTEPKKKEIVADVLKEKSPVVKKIQRAVPSKDWEATIPKEPTQPLKDYYKHIEKRIDDLSSVGITPEVQSYLQEALRCVEGDCFRAAIILSWNAAMYRIHEKIKDEGFAKFETEAEKVANSKVIPGFKKYKAKNCSTLDEFKTKVKDAEVLAGIYGLGLVTVPEATIMRGYLSHRHQCAHPTGHEPNKADALLTLEFLLKRVFENTKFKV